MKARVRRGSAPALVAVLVLALAGCGGSGDSSSSSSDASQATGAAGGQQLEPPGGGQLSSAQRAQLKSFTDCLKQQGVDTTNDGPQGGGQGGPPQQDAKTQKALQACQDKLPQGAGPPGGGAPGGAAGASATQ